MGVRCLNCGARHLTGPAPTVPTCHECETMNDCQRAFELLHNRPDAESEGTKAGPRLYIRRKIAPAGSLTDGTRLYTVAPCERWRWLVVTLGWETVAEIDQRPYFQKPEKLAAAVIRAIDQHAAPFRAELTPAGEQLVIPGCERNLAPGKTQLDLFG